MQQDLLWSDLRSMMRFKGIWETCCCFHNGHNWIFIYLVHSRLSINTCCSDLTRACILHRGQREPQSPEWGNDHLRLWIQSSSDICAFLALLTFFIRVYIFLHRAFEFYEHLSCAADRFYFIVLHEKLLTRSSRWCFASAHFSPFSEPNMISI